jgi:hypothetical protein
MTLIWIRSRIDVKAGVTAPSPVPLLKRQELIKLGVCCCFLGGIDMDDCGGNRHIFGKVTDRGRVV